MTRYLNEERFVTSTHSNEADRNYRENWERMFGDGAKEPDPDAIEAKVKFYVNYEQPVVDAVFDAGEPPDEDCDVCGAPAGEWCEDGCSEAPKP